MTRKTGTLAIPFALALLISCSKSVTQPDAPQTQGIRWSAVSVNSYPTKALVESREMMERSCTAEGSTYTFSDGTTLPGLGQTVGVWADYRILIGGRYNETRDIFKGTRLKYIPESQATDTKWDYESNPAYWVLGGQYAFRAYYPAGELNINEKISTAKSLVIEMNTATTQRDVLLAFNSYDTKTLLPIDATEGEKKELTDPVQLTFRHAMSAVKFRFKFVDDAADGVFYSEDYLTSCWFENVEEDGFALTGYLIYGDGTNYADEGLINWRYQYCPQPGIKFYHWEPPTGIPFWNHLNSDVFDKSTDQLIATAFTVNSDGEEPVYGKELIKHGGWLSVIPQPSTGNVRLCFTTKSSGSTVFSVSIPKRTGTAYEIYEKYPDDPERQKDPDAQVDDAGNALAMDDFVPGWRYTYTISISKTNAELTLGIEPWNRLDSSNDIRFN